MIKTLFDPESTDALNYVLQKNNEIVLLTDEIMREFESLDREFNSHKEISMELEESAKTIGQQTLLLSKEKAKMYTIISHDPERISQVISNLIKKQRCCSFRKHRKDRCYTRTWEKKSKRVFLIMKKGYLMKNNTSYSKKITK